MIIFVILSVSSAESQSLNRLSAKDTIIFHGITEKLYNTQTEDDIGSFDVKPEFLLDVTGDEKTYMFGITLEVELTTSQKTSWLISATPLIKKYISEDYLQFQGLVLTGGRKFYFNDSRVRGYFSMNAGFIIGKGFRLAFTPAFGFEYKFSDVIKFGTEIKSPLFFPVFTSAGLYPGINAGIGFLF